MIAWQRAFRKSTGDGLGSPVKCLLCAFKQGRVGDVDGCRYVGFFFPLKSQRGAVQFFPEPVECG